MKKIENTEKNKETSVILNLMKYLGFGDVWLCRINNISTYAQHDKKIFLKLATLFLLLTIISCGLITKEQPKMVEPKQYVGWWIYGEGQHIFKDEQTLGEWELTFPNENMQELVELYLAVCEMEYFPMECNMQGHLQNDTLEVTDFEITYIQGCGE
jgi:hypothetical protein|tara:strand:+ start:953 stop:1420 length:468 start_codon:yes stop_codon:yes gene_type:complete